eukprot:6213273-Pleurochrysis_carterae.AAC.8
MASGLCVREAVKSWSGMTAQCSFKQPCAAFPCVSVPRLKSSLEAVGLACQTRLAPCQPVETASARLGACESGSIVSAVATATSLPSYLALPFHMPSTATRILRGSTAKHAL